MEDMIATDRRRAKRELEKKMDVSPRRYLAAAAPKVAEIMGLNCDSEMLGRLKIKERRPCSFASFIGRRECPKSPIAAHDRGTIWVDKAQVAEFFISLDPDYLDLDAKGKQRIEEAAGQIIRRFLIHEFAHALHWRMQPEDWELNTRGLWLGILLFYGMKEIDSCFREQLAERIRHEAVALGTASLFFRGRPPIEDMTIETQDKVLSLGMELGRVKAGAENLSAVVHGLLKRGQEHELATYFTMFAWERYREGMVKEMLRRPPTLHQLLFDPSSY